MRTAIFVISGILLTCVIAVNALTYFAGEEIGTPMWFITYLLTGSIIMTGGRD